ncbi:MAG: PEP/pyruvate-binding domain-containing protein [Deltaproteobacteria bacterium]|nr:PEP/pyruvate-binding domain-containing protein [Deltaproteobacteria bacterium]
MVTSIRRAWQRLAKAGPKHKPHLELSEKYAHFQRLLSANNQVLALMTDMEEKLSGDYLFDFHYIRSTVDRMRAETTALVEALNGMSGNRYQALSRASAQILGEVEDILKRRREIPVAPLVIRFEDLNAEMAEIAGGKAANLGEVKNRVGLPVPPGFAISSYAYKCFLDYNQLSERLTALLNRWSMADLDTLSQVSQELKVMVHAARVPPDLEEAMCQGYARLAAETGGRPLLALRSSAVGEDLTFTFAGQYATYLNVTPEEMASRYKDIAASLFTPRALFYYKNKGFREEEMAMGVAVMPMIQAKASGVLFTRHSDPRRQDAALINAVWGLGKYAVTGKVSPDQYVVSYEEHGRVLEEVIAEKNVMLVSLPEGGVEERPVPPELVKAPCLGAPEITELLRWAEILERHYGRPQDVEWALDEDGRLWLLQSRPLKVSVKKAVEQKPRVFKDYPVLLDKGTVACRGVGAGPVVIVKSEQDLKNFPPGAVLVARHTSPKYVTVMDRAAAVITDAGSPTGHMALLAREFKVPAILCTENATRVLRPGQVVTVDANFNNVYEGVVQELLDTEKETGNDLADTPVFQTLKAVVKKVVPLNLLNPQDESFAAENCRTLHDVVRFAHEHSMREMFKLSENDLEGDLDLVDLETDLPLKVRLLDLGGGLKRGFRRKVKPQQILSLPFKAFYQGLTSMRWPQAKPAGVKSLASVFVSTEEDVAQGASRWQDQSYVVLSQNYMNFSIRLGYHLSTVEAYLSDQINDNYITFHFKGGGSTPERRERRTRLIAEIISHIDINCRVKGDFIEARVAKYPLKDMARRLTLLGKLTVYTKQLDMVLFSEGIVDWYIKDFLREHVGTGN